ncbi:PHD finger protein PERSISTENT TAPETAL CELL 1 [Typha latifolia]|uniref:PHD finger protein PERSISTENT TAPETAL CELL 1 n=1 Tax=Typha latifolia TaxID=4733 RepID=UPI003C2F25F5
MAKMLINLGGSRKRKRGERVFRFECFCEPGHPSHFNGSFQENIRTLLRFGHSEVVAQGDVNCWSFQLELSHHPPTLVRMFVVEEDVGKSPCRRCHCCRAVGWGCHIISNKRFHFLLPKNESTIESEGLCFEIHDSSSGRAAMASKAVSSRRNLMHGVIHSNGLGHLISISGFEGGSYFASGHQILDLWDRICSALRVRKVSLIDTAMKGSMELRLIHGIAYGETWFRRWGYKFGHESYGVTQQMYQQSLEALQSLPLCLLIPHFACFHHEIPMLIAKYQAISSNPTALVTLGELFRFMIELKSRLPLNSLTAMDYQGIVTETTCRWSTKRVEMAAQVIVEALKKSQVRWVTRQEVRDAARAYIGDTGLLDYVLKSLGNHVVGNYIVRRMVNPVTKVLEYCLEDSSNVMPPPRSNHEKIRVRFQLTRVQLMRDLLHLYKHILKEPGPAITTGVFGAIPVAVRMVLDIKHFVKDYQDGLQPKKDVGGHERIELNCTVRVRDEEGNGGKYILKELPPNESITIPSHATIGDLKREVERHFREIYWGLKSFAAELVVGIESKDSVSVRSLVELGTGIVVEGKLDEKDGQEICEGGSNALVVECLCGAREEDGERMVCCDICEVWQHTRCARIANDDDVPRVFLCGRCESDIVSFPPMNC